MRLLSWLKGKPAPPQPASPMREEAKPIAVRRFDAAKTDALNREQWVYAHGQSINADLATDLQSVMARSASEYTNNPFYRGVVGTYAMHVVGKTGPSLQVRSDDEQFNEAVEDAFKIVFAMPDPAGRLTGVEGLKVHVKQILIAGSSLNIYKATRRQGPVTVGWQVVHPRRLVTPVNSAGNPLFQFGIEFDSDGRRLGYHFDSYEGLPGISSPRGVKTNRVPADLVQHIFEDEEAEQAIGYPKLAAALQPAADLRRYDKEVLEAARNAAKHAVGLEASSPEHVIDPDPLPPGSTLPLEPSVVNVAPMGWRFASLQSTQPMANYPDFRRERLMEIGRPLHMPLMLVLLSSHNSNFSSAQLDGTIYGEGIADFQGMLERQMLNGCVEEIVTELVVARKVRRPTTYSLDWSWHRPPHANIEKVTNALRMQLEDGAISLVDYCTTLGLDFEQVQMSRRRVNELLEENDLPAPPVNAGNASQQSPEESTEAPELANA